MGNYFKKTVGYLFVMTLIVSCGNRESSFSLLPESDTFIQSTTGFNNKIDILFVIDSQPSMSSFQDELVRSFDTFINLFVAKGFDFRISVITTSAYMADPTLNGYDPANVGAADFNHESGGISSDTPILEDEDPDILDKFAINAKPDKNTAGQDVRAFSSFRQGLSTSREPNASFRREDAYLAIVIVDNNDDFSGNERCVGCNVSGRYDAPTLDPVDLYIQFLDNYTQSSGAFARYSVSAMTQSATPCQGGTNMVRIMDLVQKTGGVIGDICQADFGPSLAEMADRIATLSTLFYLDRVPDQSTLTVKVDGVSIANSSTNGWTYVADSNAIAFHGSAVPQQGAVIDVDYEPLTVIQ